MLSIAFYFVNLFQRTFFLLERCSLKIGPISLWCSSDECIIDKITELLDFLPPLYQLAFLIVQISGQTLQSIFKTLPDELETSVFEYSSKPGCSSIFSSLFQVSSSFVIYTDDFDFTLIIIVKVITVIKVYYN